MDTAWALQQLRSFERMTVMRNGSGGGYFTTQDVTASPDAEVTSQAPVIERVLDRVMPDWRTSVPQNPNNRWYRHREAVQRAITLLEREAELRDKLGDDAPTLSASGLHLWVWAGAKSLWGSGHYAEAVGAAARQVNAETQTKVGRRDASESDLMLQCFSDDAPAPGKPRLRLPGDDGGKSALSLRRGVRFYAQGCYAALRNPAAHDVTPELSEHEALEQLAAFSILARWVEAATLETTP